MTDPEKLENALRIGIEMRKAQVNYFKTRSQRWLLSSKRLEAEFDRLAADALGVAPQLPL